MRRNTVTALLNPMLKKIKELQARRGTTVTSLRRTGSGARFPSIPYARFAWASSFGFGQSGTQVELNIMVSLTCIKVSGARTG